ncbi:MAG: YggS family pyridoxal phosphate-dependent enzyme [Myxococcales bacterium]|jgi:pyridoxal phosphate enzyme (YggS family)|nr:YggS family pyridoxal phosphate-dependent enzyme [Myxococcales bacterium]
MGIQENLIEIRRRIEAAARRVGRDPKGIQLVAVSKFQPSEAIEEAYRCGQRLFGENYAQELRDKAVALGHLQDLRFHFIGRLQKNKAKYVATVADCMESLDDLDVAAELARRALAAKRTLSTLIEVNFDEAQKGGIHLEALPKFIESLGALEALRVEGLMAIPPTDISERESRAVFRALADAARAHHLRQLSMGMSGDYELAIEEGATLVRIGTAIFGARTPKQQIDDAPCPPCPCP